MTLDIIDVVGDDGLVVDGIISIANHNNWPVRRRATTGRTADGTAIDTPVDEPADLTIVVIDDTETIPVVGPSQTAPPHLAVFALNSELTPPIVATALRSGFTSAIDARTDPARLAAIIELTANGIASIPAQCSYWLGTLDDDRTLITAEEECWLDQLQAGMSVAALANQLSYSERNTHRILNRLYQRIGASNRHDALRILSEQRDR